VNTEARLIDVMDTLAVSEQSETLPPSKTAVSAVVGKEAGAPVPEATPQLALLFQAVEVPPIQYLVKEEPLCAEKKKIRKKKKVN